MRNVMKRFLAGTLAFMMLMGATGCAKAADDLAAGSGAQTEEAVVEPVEEAEEVAIAGGWEAAEDTAMTDDLKDLFARALEGLTGVAYEPIAYLGHQVVAGLNHCFLCKSTVIYPDAKPGYSLVYIYEDLDGNLEVKDISDLQNANNEDLLGGWNAAEDPAISEDVQAVIDKAREQLLVVDYEAIALLASQVVSGVNYKVLAQAKAVSPDAQPRYVVLTLYSALDGHVEVLSVDDVELGY